jgi:DNA-binding NarL/FixJ family response regulator
MPSQADKGTLLIIDARELRRAGIEGLMTRWAEQNAIDLVSLSPDEAIAAFENEGLCRMIVLSVGAQSITERETLQLIKVMRALSPRSPVVVMSDREESGEVVASLGAGVQGFLPSSMSRELALQAFSFILNGGSYFPPSAMREAPATASNGGQTSSSGGQRESGERKGPSKAERLSPEDHDQEDEARERLMTNRQLEVLCLLKEGQPNKVIARRLGMTEATVKVHMRQIMRKLGATNRTQAALCAMNHEANDDEELVEADRPDERNGGTTHPRVTLLDQPAKRAVN